MKALAKRYSCLAGALLILGSSNVSARDSADTADDARHEDRVVRRELTVTTQATVWPPSALTNADGDFVVIGNVLTQTAPGVIVPVAGAALVSKDTVPPLDANGKEDFRNFFGAPHRVIRPLDLRAGSRDLDIVLHTPSYGPPKGSFGGGGRIPRQGESRYNLNAIGATCPDIFPAASQAYSYMRPSYPLHEVPILGFQGDQVAYDPDTGAPYDPKTMVGPGCESGCAGENHIDVRSRKPITLGRWIRAHGEMAVELTRYDRRVRAHTAARIKLSFRRLLPNSVYTVWALRQRTFSFGSMPGPFGIPAPLVTDRHGNAQVETEMRNPFPARDQDPDGSRLVGVELVYHPDNQNWGACGERFGVTYTNLRYVDFLPDGARDLSNLLTKDSARR